ncbi:chitobiase/beta-hexosaminidase C-terminal domain-containing protein [Chitinophaga arvensicola]|uniref:Por secretion system C-terminal sorting domain-containing protein n=1 Tax=Chitinophaga arvensicola TaxID=29529 RepID=A0A1I0S9X2_9BACT|nr:chitobiase/beta-hexosaminidase C-terminal domain-containing protein [Chitinophaga arvensicola]SEW52997.1 Por secretion system C-terminal sorting domain-containing protein [Chitinophaga arvensicola]
MKQLNNVLFILCCVFALLVQATEKSAAAAGGKPLPVHSISPLADTTRGLIGYYFQDPTDGKGGPFTTLVFDRQDPNFWFNWGDNSPDPRITNDNFSVRWKGLFRVPVSGTYTFNANADDGFKFVIKDFGKREADAGTVVMNNNGNCCADFSGTVDLVAGKLYPIEVEFIEKGGGANIMYFKWTAPGIAQQQVPAEYFYCLLPQAAARPKITPDRGLFEDHVNVFLSTTTVGGTIRYTLDGTLPTINSPVFDPLKDTLKITSTTTVKASTWMDNMYVSEVSTALLSIMPPALPNPVFVPSAGIYSEPIKMGISVKEPGATIYYTIDGSTPNTSSLVYTDSIHIDSTMRIKTFAVKEGHSPSQVMAATYTILPDGTKQPVFSVPAGNYNGPQDVTITSATPGAVIRYALNENALNISSPIYTGPVKITATTTLKAYASADDLTDSKVTIASYVIGKEDVLVDTPRFTLPSGTYNGSRQVGLYTNTKDAVIYYTLDGSVPDENSTLYFNLIQVNDSAIIKAIAVKPGMKNSVVSEAKYVVTGAAKDTSLLNTTLPKGKLAITPNPASDQARISWTDMINTREGYRVTITDSKGAVVNTTVITSGYTFYIVNTRSLADGVYFVKVQSGDSVAKGKLLISH